MACRKVLFVCVENAGRSQMAEAFFKKYAPKSFQVFSAGTKPAVQLNPVVVQAMKQVGIELSGTPKILNNQHVLPFVRTINMGCMDKESCPALFVDDIDDWDIPDPKGKPLHEVKILRDQIERKVKELVAQLEKE